MVSNGADSPSSPTASSSSQSNKPSIELRRSIDSQRSNTSSPVHLNGTRIPKTLNGDESDADIISALKQELESTREEKDNLASQYRNLLSKLTTMRTTLGNKLKQDAEELDRREQAISQLTAQNEDLTTTVETLKEELISSNEETERASKELDTMRNRALQENAQESLIRERELREAQSELERCRMERDDWERTAMESKTELDELKSTAEALQRDLDLERDGRQKDVDALEAERERAENLQSVLQDFQTAKDHELQQAVKDYESRLLQVTQSLAEFKSRALNAELKLEETHTDSSRTQELEKELKEKNILLKKFRHEAVILNDHLMEALRRLRRNSSDSNVDRRLVTNVLLSFLTTPRADSKRFEMLSLLSTILSWTDTEREKAGLQRNTGAASITSPSTGFWSRSSSAAKSPEIQKTDETESFSRLWVEFLLTEAGDAANSNATSPLPRSNTSLPSSPTLPPSSPTGSKGTRRLASFTSSGSIALSSPPSRKGKEPETDSSHP